MLGQYLFLFKEAIMEIVTCMELALQDVTHEEAKEKEKFSSAIQ